MKVQTKEKESLNALYELIYGKTQRSNIYLPNDEEYLALRNDILSSRRRIYKRDILPFAGIPQIFETVSKNSLQHLIAQMKKDNKTWTFKYDW